MDLISNLHNDLQRGTLQLVAAHRDTLFAEAKRLGCNDADADDLVMRTLDRALRKIDGTDIAGAWTEIKATFEPGELKAGANDFKWNITGTATDNSPTIGFDCHVFEIEPEKRGLFIVVQ